MVKERSRQVTRAVPQGSLGVLGGKVCSPQGLVGADVLIKNGRIAKIGSFPTAGIRTINATGRLVLPGVIDSHVHMRDPGMTDVEDFATGTAAAAAGGVTTILDMPNNPRPIDSVARLREKSMIAGERARVDFGLYVAMHDGNVSEARSMVSAGAVGFKIFLGPTTGSIPPPSRASIWEIMAEAAPLGVPLVFHSEDASLVRHFAEQAERRHGRSLEAYRKSRPPICESSAIDNVAFLGHRSGAKVHIAHVSSAEGLEVVRRFKEAGAKITCEATPHHLLLIQRDLTRLGAVGKVNPPLRPFSDRLALNSAVASGVVDTLASDHAPHRVTEKKTKDIWDAPSGFPGVETLLPLMLDMVNRGKLRLERLVEMTSRNPARIFELGPAKGRIGVGADGDLVVVDMRQRWTIRAEKLHSKQKVTPYEGRVVRGAVKYTVVRGNVVYDGELGERTGRQVRASINRLASRG
jgi:dihydroorotase